MTRMGTDVLHRRKPRKREIHEKMDLAAANAKSTKIANRDTRRTREKREGPAELAVNRKRAQGKVVDHQRRQAR